MSQNWEMTCVWFLGFCLVSLGGRWGQIVLLLLVVVVMTKVWKGILLVGIFLVVFPSIQGSALFAERSVTFCGDESAKQLYMSLVGLVNHSYPLFQTEGTSVTVLGGNASFHFRWVGLGSEQKACVLHNLERESKATKSVVVSLGLYDALQKTEVSEFKKDITEMMERLAERADLSLVIVRSISVDPFLSMKKLLPTTSKKPSLETYNQALEEVFSTTQQKNTQIRWIYSDVEKIYSSMETKIGDQGWLKASIDDASELSSLLSLSSPVISPKTPSSSSSSSTTPSTSSIPLTLTEGTWRGALFRNAFWLSVAVCVAIVVNVFVYNFNKPEKKYNEAREEERKGGKEESVVELEAIVPLGRDKKAISVISRGDIFNACKSWVTVGAVLLFCFLLDFQHYYPPMDKTYNLDYFIFISLLFSLIGSLWVEEAKIAKGHCGMLNRDQTEEWRGWMQISFLLYHYFSAKPVYNLIRIFVACYVWMTGFGHFSYFWVRKDWSVIRFVKSLFRMNFLVVGILIVMETEYVHYYICPMHTFFFFLVWIITYPFNQYNTTPWVMWVKLAFAFLLCEVLWTNDWLFDLVFGIFPFLKENGSFHEWQFRSGLDRFATAFGMLFAYLYPNMENILFQLDKMDKKGVVIKSFLASFFLFALFIWYEKIGTLEKFTYNVYHPYTSFIPIFSFIFARNMFPTLRKYYLWGFSWVGKITLETYLLQFHLMLSNNNKQIVNFMEGYPNLNFLLTWALLLVLSHGTFKCTVVLSEFFFPYSLNPKKTVSRCTIIFLFSFAFVCLSYLSTILEGVLGLSSTEMWCLWVVLLSVGGRGLLFLPSQSFSWLSRLWNIEK